MKLFLIRLSWGSASSLMIDALESLGTSLAAFLEDDSKV